MGFENSWRTVRNLVGGGTPPRAWQGARGFGQAGPKCASSFTLMRSLREVQSTPTVRARANLAECEQERLS
eukprot:1908707-Rhodomonas_salina.2